MNAKPELEIFADDVKCSHGTTTGQFDDEAIFYLQTRGVSKELAKNLLVEAFADEVLDKVDSEELRIWIKEKLG
jgi:Fe-S cluster assembly protein SufD